MAETMLRTRAALTKLTRQKALWITILAVVAFSCWVQWHSGTVQEQWQQAVQASQAQLQMITTGHGCLVVTGVPGQHCTAAQIAAQKQSTISELDQAIHALRVGSAGFTIGGSVIVALGLLGTAVGFLLGVIIGLIALETEMRSGGLKVMVLAATAASRRRMLVLSMALACFVCALIAAMADIAGLIGISSLQNSLRPIVTSGTLPASSVAASIWLPILATVVAPAVGIVLVLAAGFLTQSSLAAIGSVTALIIADRLIAASATAVAPYTVIGAIGRLTSDLQASQLASASVTVRLWPSEIANGGAAAGFIEAVALAAIGLLIAAASLQRREIR